MTNWGPLLDHGVQFVFDCYYHYMQTGDSAALQEPLPRLLRFAQYLESIIGVDGLIPVENLGTPCVWIDHCGFKKQRHKQGVFNLYIAAMFDKPLSELCRYFGHADLIPHFKKISASLIAATKKVFWADDKKMFIDNLPWSKEEGELRTHDRTHATAVLFDQIPSGMRATILDELIQCPASMGFSYPANACWRLWALMHAGRAQTVIDDLRSRWYPLASVHENNSLQEDWVAQPDTCSQWSHSPVSPILMVHGDIAGIKATAPGYKKVTIRPQLGDIPSLSLINHTPLGPIVFESVKEGDGQRLSITIPVGCEAELLCLSGCALNLKMVEDDGKLARYCLPVGESSALCIAVDKSRN